MGYRYLLADNDMTLMDFRRAEAAAFRETAEAFALPEPDALYARYHRINREVWEAFERGELTQDRLKVLRFERLLAEAGIGGPGGEALSLAYEDRLSRHGEAMPGAADFLTHLKAAGMKIALVTNGISRIQRGRLAVCGFAPLLDAVVISAEAGTAKPDPRLVEIALERLGCPDRRQAVLLGDSLTADIAAAAAAGIDCIWLNPEGRRDPRARWTARSLAEAEDLILRA